MPNDIDQIEQQVVAGRKMVSICLRFCSFESVADRVMHFLVQEVAKWVIVFLSVTGNTHIVFNL